MRLRTPIVLASATPRRFLASRIEKRIWQESALDPLRKNLALAVRARGGIDLARLEAALGVLARRHEPLRTRFLLSERELIADVAEEADLEFSILRTSPGTRDTRAKKEALRTFDVAHGPLWRASLLSIGEANHLLVLASHALIADAQSLEVWLHELVDLYDARATIAPLPPISYAASASRARIEEENARRTPDLDRLDPIALRPDHPAGSTLSGHAARSPIPCPASLYTALTAFSRRHAVSLETTLLAIFEVLLFRSTERREGVIGIERDRRVVLELDLAGPLTDVIVLSADLDPKASASAFAHRVRDALRVVELEPRSWAEAAEAEGRPPIVEALFAFTERRSRFFSCSLDVERFDLDIAGPSAAIALRLFHDEAARELVAFLEYDRERFDPDTVARMADHFGCLASAFAADASMSIATLPMLGLVECERLLAFGRGPTEAVPDVPVHRMFEAAVDRTPDAIAIACEDGAWSYRALDRRATKLARQLSARGVGRGALVAIYLDRSPELIAALLAVLKAGAGYVPLDAGYPSDRLARILDRSQPALILTHSALVPSLPERTSPCLLVDAGESLNACEGIDRSAADVRADDVAYVIFTSGSTGEPKGVVIEHRQLAHYITAATRTYGIRSNDRVLQFASISFDASVEEIFPALAAGATIVLRRSGALESVRQFFAACEADGVTVLSLPTAYWHELTLSLERKEAQIFRSLRLVIIGGEQASSAALLAWQKNVRGSVELLNTYGPSEGTVVATAWDAASAAHHEATKRVPIGRPLPNTTAYVLDAGGRLAPIGVPGELVIGGLGIARGYLGAADLTRERFVPDVFSPTPDARAYRTGDRCRVLANGDLEFLGRSDDQLKINGHRIELGEIESRLRAHADVKEAVVVARTELGHDVALFAYVVAKDDAVLDPNALRTYLLRWLQPHLVPSIVIAGALPLTTSGKIDRRALPLDRPPANVDIDAARDPIEQLLLEVFREVLPNRGIRIGDDFFALGGDSIKAVELASILGTRLEIAVEAEIIYAHPTIRALARQVLALVKGEPDHRIATMDLATEAMLDREIACSPTKRPSTPRDVFLTGATGFFGAFLLAALIEQTEAPIHCLVRARSIDEATERLRDRWSQCFDGRPLPIDRIALVVGDLAKPRLGLEDRAFKRLASQIGAIVHAGAMVHYLMPYASLRASNVLGTEEVLRLAALGGPTPIHHVSSLAVFGSPGVDVKEGTPLECAKKLGAGYAQSKWVAEKLAEKARQAGLPVAVYRVGRITGHTMSGVSNASDLFVGVLEACAELGAAPDLDILVDMVPVDFASASLVHLARRPESIGGTFHIGHPRPIAWRDLVDRLSAFGCPLRVLPFEVWTRAVKRLALGHRGGKALLFVASLSKSDFEEALGARYDCTATIARLQGSAVVPPPIDERLLDASFAYLARTGRLPTPKGTAP
jgi:amino acid adenylation domain-containing protein/thioester reductase-like protein